MKLIEVSFEGELVLRPDSFEALNELSRPSVTLGMVEPPLTDARELGFEPPGDHIHRDTSNGISNTSDSTEPRSPIAVVVDAGNLLCCNGWVPRSWKQRRY